MYKSTKEVRKDFRSNQEDKLQHHLTSQGFSLSNVIKYSLSSVNSIWSEAQSHLPWRTLNFTILPSATTTTPSLHVRIWQDGEYHKVLIAHFALILNHSFMLSLVVNSTLIALHGDTTQSLTSLPSHFNLKLMFTLHSMQMPLNNNWWKLSSRSSFPNPVHVPICSKINSWFRV